MRFIKFLLNLMCYMGNRFINEGFSYRVGSLTYTTLLAIVPLLAVSFSVFSLFPAFNSLRQEAKTYLITHITALSNDVITKNLEYFMNNAAQLSLLGTLFLILSALLLIYSIDEAINAVWRTAIKRQRFVSFLLYWSLITLVPLLIAISFTLSTYLSSFAFLKNYFSPILNLFSYGLSVIALMILYIMVPNTSIPWRYGALAALLTTLIFSLSREGFIIYMQYAKTNYTIIYGAMASLPIFLIWLYLSWMIILGGALFCEALMHFSAARRI